MANQLKIVIEDVDKCPVETIDQFITILERLKARKEIIAVKKLGA